MVRLPDAGALVAGRCLADYRDMRDVVLPCGLRAVKSAWFANSAVCSVEIPSTVAVIEDYAFANCGSLERVAFSGQSQVLSIGRCAFSGTALAEFNAPAKCAELAERAFWRCSKLVWVKLNSGLQRIGRECFGECGFAQLVIPNSVVEIAARAFCRCGALKAVVVQSGSQAVIDASAFAQTDVETLELPAGVSYFPE